MSERRVELIPGVYRHFKGNLYQVFGVASHSETGDKLVVYRALYDDYRLYVRPYDMFCSEVDTTEHPNASQKMRFELITPVNDAV